MRVTSLFVFFFFSSRRRHTRCLSDWSSDVCSSDLYTHAGPEIGVASTKAFTCQLTALFILAMYLGQANGSLGEEASRALVQELVHLPGKLEIVLSHDPVYEALGKELHRSTDFLFLGRGVHFPIALEGALKLKEISYIHAE